MVFSQDFHAESNSLEQISGECLLGPHGDKHHTTAELLCFHLAWDMDWCEAWRA